MSTQQPHRLLAIALDAAEPTLVEKWVGDGTMPNLMGIRSQGVYGRLRSSADWLAGSPWPTFYTGTTPAEHGLFEAKQWNPGMMMQVEASPEWLPLRPFWRDLGKDGIRVISVDLPMTYLPEPIDGVEICGWMTYDSIGNKGKPVSYPAWEIARLRNEDGIFPPRIPSDRVGVQTAKSLLSLRDQLVAATGNTSKLAERLMEREAWDLFMVAFSAPHRGGHKLWDLSATVRGVDAGDREELRHALRDVYAACDKAVGRLVKAAGKDSSVMVYSLHGMGPNTDRTFLLSKILDTILRSRQGSAQPAGTKKSALRGTRDAAAKWLPMAFPPSSRAWKLAIELYHAQGFFRMQPQTGAPAFRVLSCLNGCIRISLRGREKYGVVEKEEYDRLCSDIVEGFKSFVDADTGQPIVEKAVLINELYEQGERRSLLPDIILRWAPTPAISSRKVASARYPQASFSLPLRNLSGRSGNHLSSGFLLVRLSGATTGGRIEGADILDLAPTILGLLGVEKPRHMHGKPLLGERSRAGIASAAREVP